MAHILIYTSPARGHLYPVLGPGTELAERGHEVTVVTLSSETAMIRDLGLKAESIAEEVEARELDDYKGRNTKEALDLSLATFRDRAPFDFADLQSAIKIHNPDGLIVDNNSWGGLTAAEASGLPWCSFQPYFTPIPSKDAPPFGPGFALATGPIGKLRDRVLSPVVMKMLGAKTLPMVNDLRAEVGLDPLSTMTEFLTRPPRTLYFTAEPLEYPRSDWPASYKMIGPATWSPPSQTPTWLDEIDQPIILVTCSTERLADRAILESALKGLADEDVFVIGTSAAEDPDSFDVPPNARVERFLPHDPIIKRAAAVVCHGGMGITQKALSNGVPVCVVPHGRDQPDVARRVEFADAGVRLPLKKLDPRSIREAVATTRTKTPGADRVAKGFSAAGGSARAADIVETLIG